MDKDVLSLISHKLPTLSKGKKSIASYILEHPNEAAFITAAKLGTIVKVSESSVVRFAGDLGFQGYPALQKALQDVLMVQLSERGVEPKNDPFSKSGRPLDDLPEAEIKAQYDALAHVSSDVLRDCAQLLAHCNTLYLYGSEDISYLVRYINYTLKAFSMEPILLSGCTEEDYLRKLLQLSPRDGFLCLAGEVEKQWCFLRHYANISGAKGILISDHRVRVDPFGGEINIQIPLKDHRGLPMGSGAEAVLHCILELLAMKKARELNDMQNKLKEIQGIYYGYDTEAI